MPMSARNSKTFSMKCISQAASVTINRPSSTTPSGAQTIEELIAGVQAGRR